MAEHRQTTAADRRRETVSAVLPYPLDEFRSALEAEIEAASRESAAAAVSLHSGKRIGQVGGIYQYVFKIETALNLPTDSPGELHVDGREPVNATIISVEGLTVTVSVEQDLGPSVPFARLRNDLAFLLRRLIGRIEGYAESSNPAGDRLLGSRPPSGRSAPVDLDGLNAQQRDAIASALGRDTTFIWGPPGTGKTATIGQIGAELHGRGRSLLLVSHTNIAVDQALLRIADLIKAERPGVLESGKVLRVGEPRDSRLRDRPELLLAEHAKRRSEELAARLERLQSEREQVASDVLEQLERADLAEWVELAADEIAEQQQRLETIAELATELKGVEAKIEPLAVQEAIWREELRLAQDAQRARTEAAELAEKVEGLKRDDDALTGTLAQRSEEMRRARAGVERSEQLQPAFAELRELPSAAQADEDVAVAQRAVAEAREDLAEARVTLGHEHQILDQAQASGAIARRWKGLPKLEEQQVVVREAQAVEQAADRERRDAEAALAAAEQQQRRRAELADQLRGDRHLEDLDAVRSALTHAVEAHDDVQSELRELRRTIRSYENQLEHATATVEAFAHRFTEGHERIAERATGALAEVDDLRQEREQLQQQANDEEHILKRWLRDRHRVLQEARLITESSPHAVEERLRQIVDAHQRAQKSLQGLTAAEIRTQIDNLNRQIESLDQQIAEVEDALARVEEELVAEATIVATTLTRAYLRDYIQERRFDTVVLDEASMAPIPALWVAAGVADHGVVIVGDPEQLPPIKHSQLDVAEKWLGEEIFTVSGVLDGGRNGGADHLVQLRTQYRMHPDISRLPNKLVYDNRLVDGPGAAEDEDDLDGWYDRGWGGDAPVLLVDTGPLDAWVTTVDRGTKTSRLNFLSATVACDLAEKMLTDERDELEPGSQARILIVTPYRPQANLLERLIEHQGLDDEVAVGTAHSFQGNEAPIVILDLVVDEPHWRVGLFIPDLDEQNRKLLNVALTRARKRLVVVGDFDYAAKKAKNAFLGRLIRELQSGADCVPADELLTVGLSAKAAKAHLEAVGGPIQPDEERLVVSQGEFFSYLAWDLQHARERAIIYSPFMTVNRLEWLDPHLRAAVERGTSVYAITKPIEERNKSQRDAARTVEERLARIGVKVLHKRMMHEKVVIVDDHITWVGSLNALSFANTGEVMERRESRQIVSDYLKTLHVDEIISSVDQDEIDCPVCGEPMDAAEGDRGPYWRCPDRCYTRSLDEPPPREGLLPCRNCGAPVDFGDWGGKPHWRCQDNLRHRMPVRKNHLRLPKMKALIPKKDLAQLERRWG